MPSESVAGFLDHAQASRVLFPEQIQQLIRQPDIPHTDLSALCEYLLSRGVLTRFQATAIREGRGQDLSYGGYPVIDELGPCAGGTEYKALHPSLRTPIVLRRVRAGWLAPTDSPGNLVARARAFGMLAHPNLVHLLDAGAHEAEVYFVIDQPAGSADLEALSKEIGGAMPGFLAAEYGRAIASALRSAHERGGAHGDVRPANLVVGPLAVKTGSDGKPRRRPAPEAVVRLAELGLVPIRPPAADAPETLTPYLPPERLNTTGQDARGDMYGLGASLYFLLAGRPPFAADDPELAAKVRSAEPPPLAALRPDLPADFVAFVTRMLDKNPDRRPATAQEAEATLVKFCRPGTVPPQLTAIPVAYPASAVVAAHPVATAEAVPEANVELAPEPADDWGVSPGSFDTSQADTSPSPSRRRGMTDEERSRGKMLMLLGGGLHITAIVMLVLWLTGTFDSPPAPSNTSPQTAPTKKDDGRKPVPKGKG